MLNRLYSLNEIPENDQRVDLKDLSPDALVEFLSGMGKEKFRAVQVLRWIYQRKVTDFSAMTDLAKDFRCLNECFASQKRQCGFEEGCEVKLRRVFVVLDL